MFHRGIHRRLVALVAAYGLALHGVLTVFVVASPALALDAPLCSAAGAAHDGDTGRKSPAHDADCPLCPLICAVPAPLPSFAASLVPPVGSGEALVAPRPAVPVARVAVHAGLARAPPA